MASFIDVIPSRNPVLIRSQLMYFPPEEITDSVAVLVNGIPIILGDCYMRNYENGSTTIDIRKINNSIETKVYDSNNKKWQEKRIMIYHENQLVVDEKIDFSKYSEQNIINVNNIIVVLRFIKNMNFSIGLNSKRKRFLHFINMLTPKPDIDVEISGFIVRLEKNEITSKL